MSDINRTPSAERCARIQKWAEGYRVLSRNGLDETVHTAATEASRIGDDTFAYLTVTDVEWLLRVARVAGRAAAEARAGREKFWPASFDEVFPASAELARTVYTEED